MISIFLNYYMDGLDNAIYNIANRLGDGQAKDYPEYRGLTGRIAGLREARQIAEDLRRQLVDEDSDMIS